MQTICEHKITFKPYSKLDTIGVPEDYLTRCKAQCLVKESKNYIRENN